MQTRHAASASPVTLAGDSMNVCTLQFVPAATMHAHTGILRWSGQYHTQLCNTVHVYLYSVPPLSCLQSTMPVVHLPPVNASAPALCGRHCNHHHSFLKWTPSQPHHHRRRAVSHRCRAEQQDRSRCFARQEAPCHLFHQVRMHVLMSK